MGAAPGARRLVSRGAQRSPATGGEPCTEWLGRVGVETLLIKPGTPWENGYAESLNGRLRNECLDG